MEIILRAAIDELGHPGDLVTVKAGYARNYLVPQKLAYVVTPGNLKIMEQKRNNLLRREAKQRGEAEKLREVMSAVEISLTRRVGEQDVLYGSVTTSDIADELEKQGFEVDKRKINLDEHIKQLGEFVIPIRLFADVVAEVKLSVQAESKREGEAGEETAPPTESEPESASE
jgi:large subunit ribosomal protein L9